MTTDHVHTLSSPSHGSIKRYQQLPNVVISDVDQLSADWLSNALRSSGALEHGAVQAYTVDTLSSTWAHMARIKVAYQSGSTGTLPTALLLKMCDGTFGSSEVEYYARDYVDLIDAPLLRTYSAAYDPRQRRYHILMDDLSATHQPNWEITPTPSYAQALARALATLHAHWWGADRLWVAGSVLPGRANINRYMGHIRQGLEPLIAESTGAIDPRWADTLRDVFARHPNLMIQRARIAQGFTLVHGDVNPGNVLSPRHSDGPIYLIDRQPFDWSLTVWLGVSDLAYAIVHWWEPDIRRQLEWPMLRAYHQTLQQRGVTDYHWEQLVYDYRLCAVQSLYVATEWCVLEADRSNMRWLWLTQLRRAMAAFEDLRCAELWS